MPPKNKISKEEIIEAAFQIAKEEGLSGITVRNVAKHLGCSIAPIYVNFETIDDLTNAVTMRVLDISKELLAEQKGLDMFENIGKASIAFARKYPVLLRELIMRPNPYMDSYETFETDMLEMLNRDEMMCNWSIEEQKSLLLKMRIFQTGLQVMIANGQLPSQMDEKTTDALLMETGADFFRAQQMKQREKNE